jgi:hypothetical protein
MRCLKDKSLGSLSKEIQYATQNTTRNLQGMCPNQEPDWRVKWTRYLYTVMGLSIPMASMTSIPSPGSGNNATVWNACNWRQKMHNIKLNFEQWKESDYQEINPVGVHRWQRMNISVPDKKFESSQIKVFFHAQNTQEGSNLNFWDWPLCCIPPIPSETLAGLETHRLNKHFWSISCYPCVESCCIGKCILQVIVIIFTHFPGRVGLSVNYLHCGRTILDGAIVKDLQSLLLSLAIIFPLTTQSF